jgi:hypothetical protein
VECVEVDMLYFHLEPVLHAIEGIWSLYALVAIAVMLVKMVIARWQGEI